MRQGRDGVASERGKGGRDTVAPLPYGHRAVGVPPYSILHTRYSRISCPRLHPLAHVSPCQRAPCHNPSAKSGDDPPVRRYPIVFVGLTATPVAMWRMQIAPDFERAKRYYDKKRPAELAAVLRNLARLLEQLNSLPHCRAAHAGFLHHEPAGIWALDQKGPSRTKLQETRLYVFPAEENRVLHIITVGNKNSQAADLRCALDFVRSLEPPHQP